MNAQTLRLNRLLNEAYKNMVNDFGMTREEILAARAAYHQAKANLEAHRAAN